MTMIPLASGDIGFHLRTLWLFTQSDIKSMIYPNLLFGYVTAISQVPASGSPSSIASEIASRVPPMLLWLWSNLLLFNISNQRLAASIVEDGVNKSWRPLPSERLRPSSARRLLLGLIPVVVVIAKILGVLWHSLSLIALTWMYNDLCGADDHYLIRNLINAHGMALYSAGALQLAIGKQESLDTVALQWICIIAVITFSTIHLQDMPDQAGDYAKGRKTLPLAIGDDSARWTIACGVLVWSIAAPSFWHPTIAAYVPPVVVGLTLSFRVMLYRSVEADRSSWKMWCLWMMSIYLVPLFA